MSTSTKKAEEIIKLVQEGRSVSIIKATVSTTDDEWHRYSSKAYNISIEDAKKDRKAKEKQRHVAMTSNDEISSILLLNERLSDYALLLPIMSTMSEVKAITPLLADLPSSERLIIKIIARATMEPRLRTLQKKGRFEIFDHFKIFSKMIDAATICYYRANFTSCFLTLLPVVEGIIIRWMGYSETGEKPEFEDIRGFFRNSHQRQPCPSNILFHNVFAKACDKILNHHFYKPTTNSGPTAYANFNRHVASHLLSDDQFATNENCIRLFILLDAMTEVFLYESLIGDPRFSIRNDEIKEDVDDFANLIMDNLKQSPEHRILGTKLEDIIV